MTLVSQLSTGALHTTGSDLPSRLLPDLFLARQKVIGLVEYARIAATVLDSGQTFFLAAPFAMDCFSEQMRFGLQRQQMENPD